MPEEVETPQETSQELPETASDRTKEQFEKLKESNQQLKQEKDQLKNVLESLRPEPTAYIPPVQSPSPQEYQHLDQQQINDTYQSLVDENGFVDTQLFRKTLEANDRKAKEAAERARQAEERAQRAETAANTTVQKLRDFEENQLAQRVHKDFPQLDPASETFNPVYWEAVRNDLKGSMIDGKEPDFLSAAAKWAKVFVPMAPKQEETDTQADAKRQINATTPKAGGSPAYTASDQADLVQQTRKGNTDAIMERIRRAGG